MQQARLSARPWTGLLALALCLCSSGEGWEITLPLQRLWCGPPLFLSLNKIDKVLKPQIYLFCGTVLAAEPPLSPFGRGGTQPARTQAVSC